ncbi:MAG: DUF973 family protein [Nitrososphaerota archaeon]|uniref:DUF996 domain-containing protein n=3 Tax=Candidatus Bathycorpusculum sp. TaxID=2994959 RepID=UPI00281D249A|nr:DUF973 family protein [Candidatus Termiticorpusculum sp.]MCL2292348.1 DUF973 family protein [Candidatus Termiticorpusculum sp.]MDR0461248.1 DUF973 family protein [Nitrososphaerota archaeon]
MTLESAKSYGYIASIIFCVMPIISYISSIVMSVQLFQIFTNILSNPNAETNSSLLAALTSSSIAVGVGLITVLALSLIALILFLIAQYKLSKYYNEPSIFRNFIYIILFAICYSVIVVIVVAIFFIATITTASVTAVTSVIIAIVVLVVLTIIFIILEALLWYRAFKKLSEKSGVDAFKTAGLLYVIGMFISIVTCIAWYFAAKGYKQLKPQQTPNNDCYTTPTYNPSATPTLDRIFCSQCGAENLSSAIYCKHCGQPIQTTPINTTTTP